MAIMKIRGDDGKFHEVPSIQGTPGATPNITIGTVDTLPAGSKATAEITGETPNLVLNMGIPEGKQGDPGSGGGTIDDDVLGKDTTWSSRMIVDSLAHSFEVSGPIVNCTPIEEYPLSVASQIKYVQEGEGDPTPDNIRAILGYTEARINITGKNLFDVSKIEDIPGKIVNNGDGTITVTAGSGDSAIYPKKTLRELAGDLPQGDYYLNATTTGSQKRIYLIGVNKIWNFGTNYEITPAVLDSEVAFYSSGVNTTATLSDIYLSPAALSGPYVPYNTASKVFSVTFEDTVYGGVLNLASGELTVQYKHFSFTGDEDFTLQNSSDGINRYWLVSTGIKGNDPDIVSNMYKTLSGTTQKEVGVYSTGNIVNGTINFHVLTEDFPDADAFKSFLRSKYQSGSPVEVVAKIGKQYTVSLTPVEIKSISGINSLFSNTGDISVSGRSAKTFEKVLLSESIDKEVSAFYITEGLEGVKTIRAVLGTPSVEKNVSYLKIVFFIAGKQYLVMPLASAPRTSPTQISIKLSIKDSGIAELNVSGGSNQSDLSAPQVYNPVGNVANVFSQFKIPPYSSITKFIVQAYDTSFPKGTSILIEGEGV